MIVHRSDLIFRPLPGRDAAAPFDDGRCALRIVRLRRIPDRAPHVHPHLDELIHVTRGSGLLWTNGETSEVAAGDVVQIPAGIPHATIPDPDVEMELVCFFLGELNEGATIEMEEPITLGERGDR